MIITVLKDNIISGNRTYPLFIGFMKASDILKVSEVPNFSEFDSDESIAINLKSTPVKNWQRPLIVEKREKITKFFSNRGEFMPNPVLLSENPDVTINYPIRIVQKIIGGETTQFWELQIDDILKTFWIIDGQHRIKGLGHQDCLQNNNPIPVVFMFNINHLRTNYSPTDYAKVFAQVTTSSTPLNDLHKEWLEYAFKMDKYKDNKFVESMETVISLCSNPNFEDNGFNYNSNYFYRNIVFNDKKRADNNKLNCQLLTQLIHDYYYNEQAKYQHLSPKDLALQITKAFYELSQIIVNPTRTVFFGDDNDKRHMVMIKSFLKGILKFILLNANPTGAEITLADWNFIFTKLNIQLTDWDWSSHTNPKDKSWYKDSEKLASHVFLVAFEQESVPDGCENFQDCIVFGNNFSVTFQCKDDSVIYIENITSNRTINRPGINNIRIIEKSNNAEIISVVDKRTTANFPEWFKMDYSRDDLARKNTKPGINLPEFRRATQNRPRDYDSGKDFTLEIRRVRYGGNYDSFEVRFII
jgi:DGQHR domain-containing protein